MADPSRPDQAARGRIGGELGSTLFVEAGAGSGKTAELVNRVVALVTSGQVELGSIAAITFTDKAATELRDRLRQESERGADGDRDGETDDRCRQALEQLDGSAIGTLHSFAQRILSEHPIEAGLPPRVEVVDEVSSEVAFGRRWVIFHDRLLADTGHQRTILLLAACGIRFDALKFLARTFNDNWDLVAERIGATAPEPPDARTLVGAVLDELDQIQAEPCADPDDAFRIGLDEIAHYAAGLRRLTDELDLLEALPGGPQPAPSFKLGNKGRQASFPADLGELRSRVREAGERLEAIRLEVANACVTNLGCALREFTLEAAEERRRHGQLEFHDLLVLRPRPAAGHRVGTERAGAAPRAIPAAPPRRVPGHRPHPDRTGRPDRRRPPRPPRGWGPRLERASGRARAGCSSSATPSSRSTGSGAPTSRCSWPPPPDSARTVVPSS